MKNNVFKDYFKDSSTFYNEDNELQPVIHEHNGFVRIFIDGAYVVFFKKDSNTKIAIRRTLTTNTCTICLLALICPLIYGGISLPLIGLVYELFNFEFLGDFASMFKFGTIYNILFAYILSIIFCAKGFIKTVKKAKKFVNT